MTDNNNYNLDYNPFFNWGMIFFLSGFLNLTIIPFLAMYFFIYPPDGFFNIPSVIMLLIAMILWFFSTETVNYQAIVIGCGLVFYSLFQICFANIDFNSIYFIIYIISISIGLSLVFSAYDILINKIRNPLNHFFLLNSCIFSLLLIFLIIRKLFQ